MYLDQDGREIGTFDYCLPREFAVLNVLPEARQAAAEVFATLDIPWHGSVDGGPSNHLLDSQVMCVNALIPVLDDPVRLKRLFEGVLPIHSILQAERGWYASLEWIGLSDYLGESQGQPRRRGTMATSADAIVVYTNLDGDREAALVEWKYREHYERYGPKPSWLQERYRALWEAGDCPLRHDIIPYEDLFIEPFYQLMRLTLLGHAMQRAGEFDATTIRIVYAAPAMNDALADSRRFDSHVAAGTGLFDIWPKILVDPDRFALMDTARLLDPSLALVSEEFTSRYDHIATSGH